MKTTVVTALLLLPLFAAACGSHRSSDTYARGASLEQQCCESLAGAARDSCLGELVRIDDTAVRSSTANQATYACVTEHFACDSHIGRATQVSAQEQLECIQDL